MTRERAEATDQTSFGTMGTAEAPGKLCRPTMAPPEPGRMLRFLRFQGVIRGMSVNRQSRLHGIAGRRPERHTFFQ